MCRFAVSALACAALLGGCGGSGSDEAADGRATPAPESSPALAGGPIPLGCEHAVPDVRVEVPERLVRPRGVRVVAESVTPRPDDPTITIVEGYVERVPSALAKSFAATPGVEVLFTEDEEFEAEVMVSDGDSRAFWKVVRTCLAASRFSALFASERAADAVTGAAPPTKRPIRPRRR